MHSEPKDLDWLFKHYMPFFEKFEMRKDNIVSAFYQWKTENVGGVSDFLWAVLEKLLDEAQHITKEETFYKVHLFIYKEMWKYKANIKEVNANDLYKKYLYCGLKLYEIYNTLLVSINSGKCCPYCDALNNTIMSVAEALDKQYLASEKCTNELCCSCLYLAEFEK